jgi:hypothetical protein
MVQLGHRREAVVAGSLDAWSVGVSGGTPPRYGGRPGSSPGRTLDDRAELRKQNGLFVQREDAWLATRRSGFDSPVVH